MEIGGLKSYAQCTLAREKEEKELVGSSSVFGPNMALFFKKNDVTTQLTTSNRCAIAVPQQWPWHTRYESAIGKLRQLNTGVCHVTGKAFGELLQHFILGGDETYMQGNAGSL
jgi:hypothetical protein